MLRLQHARTRRTWRNVTFDSWWRPTRKQGEAFSVASQLLHFTRFRMAKHKRQFDRGVMITSIDIDVGSRLLGEKNNGRNDANIHHVLSEARVGEIEEQIVPRLLRLFGEMEVPVTFAVRGQLTELDHTVLGLILGSPVKHDIGAHGYSHKAFSKMSESEARREMELIAGGFSRFPLQPRSFVFPRNKIAHLHILEEFGYTNYRESGGLLHDDMFIRKTGKLYDVHPSFHLGSSFTPVFLNKIIDISVKHGLSSHFWFHPRDLYETTGSVERNIQRVIVPLYSYAKKKAALGQLRFETMMSATMQFEAE
jgi:peptidoglycan/xylan/chitin deacetylase (PgdA/CDA1 family)